MSGLLLLRALLFAGECFLASALLPLFAFAVAALLRRRAALRHLAWTTMFGVLAVLPFTMLLLPARRIVEHVAAPAAMPLEAAPAIDAAPVLAAPSAPIFALFTLENAVLLILAVWLTGLAWQLLRLALGGFGLMRLRRASAPFRADIDTGCDIRLSDGEDGPSTFGVLRPVVLLPQSALAWPRTRLEAVLRHEAAHVVRRDTANQLLARLVCAVFWLNPLLWLALRALRRDAEIAADDAVLASGMTPSLYAAELLGLAAESRGLAPGIAMAGSPLAERVQSVLATTSTRTGVTRMDIAKTACLGLAAALLLGAARFDIAVAQDVAPPAPVAPATPATPATPPDAARMAQRSAEMDAKVSALKAKADAVAAKAKAKAEAETDPAKRQEDMAQAEVMRAQSERMKAQADQMRAQAEQMRVQMAQIRPQLELALANAHVGEQVAKAMADAHISETVAKALADAHIDEKVAKALAEAHLDEQTAKAIASVHLEETINKAMAEAQPKIRAALERAQRAERLAPPMPPEPALPPPAPVAPLPPVPDSR
jgi:beta-lactamase regulating signal transducer with metallopeptidase domain